MVKQRYNRDRARYLCQSRGILIVLGLMAVMALGGCGIVREFIKRAPDDVEVPKHSLQATCEQENITYRFVYQGDGVYMVFIDGVRQDDAVLHEIQEQAFLHGESVDNYLQATFGPDGCLIEPYED